MNKIIVSCLIGAAMTVLFTGCGIDVRLGGGSTTKMFPATVGQQLVDLKKAKDAGAINEAEYESQKEKILNAK